MTSEGKFPRLFAWGSMIPHTVVLGSIIALFYWFGMPWPVFCGSLAFAFLSLVLKLTFTKDLRKGTDALNAKHYAEALPWLDRSAAFFQRYPWLDRYRYLLLLSSSALSYREMTLVNRALCIGRTRSFEETDEAFKAVLHEFPDSALAKITRRMMYANDTHP